MSQLPTNRTTTLTETLRALASREFSLRKIAQFIVRWRVEIIVAFGIVLRLIEYLHNRGFWMDEGSLSANVVRKSLAGLFGPLDNTQLAPPGFLAVEWIAVRLLGRSPYVMRLFPMLCGLASLFLFVALARRCLSERVVWAAVALMAVQDDLVYYSCEFKQYSSDVAFGLLCCLVGLRLRRRSLSVREYAGLGAFGAMIVWFSHASALVLAGVGASLVGEGAISTDRRRCRLMVVVCLAWVISFVGVYAISQEQLGHGKGMWVFWDFSFPRVPPSTLREALWLPHAFLYFFVNPLNFETPLGSGLSIVAPVVLYLAGYVSYARRDRFVLAILVAPLLITLFVAYPRLYPFHGRLVVFLIPYFLLLISEGIDALSQRGRLRIVRAVLITAVLLFPTLEAINYAFFTSRERVMHNAHGDRRPPQLYRHRFPF
jgi:hypothetical protein